MLGERSAVLMSRAMARLMAAAVLTAPYIPLLFMGEEWGATEPFLYFVDHTDPALNKAVREGRKQEFAAFSENGDPPAPDDERTFLRSRPDWTALEQEPHHRMLDYYKALIHLRRSQPALACTDRSQLSVQFDKATQTMTVLRRHDGQLAVLLLNFSNQTHTAQLPAEATHWHLALNSFGPDWGTKENKLVQKAGDIVAIAPESMVVYLNRYV
jgi:maltooligosyltrehalose trehalohydrolase